MSNPRFGLTAPISQSGWNQNSNDGYGFGFSRPPIRPRPLRPGFVRYIYGDRPIGPYWDLDDVEQGQLRHYITLRRNRVALTARQMLRRYRNPSLNASDFDEVATRQVPFLWRPGRDPDGQILFLPR